MNANRWIRAVLAAVAGFLGLQCVAPPFAATAAEPKIERVFDLQYAEASGVPLYLDLYLPQPRNQKPLVVFIHGGSWRNYDRKRCSVQWLAEAGYPLASIDYRLSQQAPFPAQIHDCKSAVRWLRAHADEYGFRKDKVVAIGTSAGAHLAVLLGVADDVTTLQAESGEHLDESSRVQAIVDYYGPTDFELRSKTQPSKTEDPAGNVYQLLGGPVRKNLPLARLASGLSHVSKDDPPLFILHGLLDRKVNVQQAVSLFQAYKQHDLSVTIRLIEDAGHGGDQFFTEANRQSVMQFIEAHTSASP